MGSEATNKVRDSIDDATAPDSVLLAQFDTQSANGNDDNISISPPNNIQPKASLTFTNGLALVISLQIGSAIFTVPSLVSNHTSGPLVAISVWIVSGALCYTGAMAFAELGTRIPENGGTQEYLRHAYGEGFGCYFAWMFLFIVKPCSLAVISTIFSDYLCESILPEDWQSTATQKTVALVGLCVVTTINCLGIRTGALVANGFMCLKIAIISYIALGGLAFSVENGPADWQLSVEDGAPIPSVWSQTGDYVTAMYGALYCYGGWESVGFVAGELKEPSKNIPRVMNTAMLLVVLGFACANAALYTVVPFQAIRDTETPYAEFAARLTKNGETGLWAELAVAASAIGSLNANIFATGRVWIAAAKRGYVPGIFSDTRLHDQHLNSSRRTLHLRFLPLGVREKVEAVTKQLSTPSGDKALNRALIFNALVVSIYIMIGKIDALVVVVGLLMYFLLSLAAFGIFIIRRKNLAPTGIYTAPTLYIVVFCTVSFILVLRDTFESPMEAVGFAGLAALVWALYRFIPKA